ncbi:MAG: hypothetical protein ACXVLZ_16085 [Acidimicrobiia bacterium]
MTTEGALSGGATGASDQQLSLDGDEVSVLRDLVHSALGDLRMEIAATDNASFREGLRTREVILRAILGRLGDA